MIASLMTWGKLFEAVMLTCFGCSWPISIYKSLSTKHVRGKSVGFMILVFIGYLFGSTSKFLRAAAVGEPPEWVTFLYMLNAGLVATDLLLYFKYRNNPDPALTGADIPATPEAEI